MSEEAKSVPVTVKTVTFEFPGGFRYARNGIFDYANAITVCEPGFSQRAVFRQMQTYVAKMRSIAKRRFAENISPELLQQLQDLRDNVEKDKADAGEAEPVDQAAVDAEVFAMFAELGDDYPKFTEYVQKALTGNKELAFVGSDISEALKDRIPVTDEVWMNVAAGGGMEAIDKVLGAFASFFVK